MSATCPIHTGLEVASIDHVQAGGVSDLIVTEPSALRRGTGALDPAAEIPLDITDSDAVDGILLHIFPREGDGLPEHWVFSSSVNTNASEAVPDFDVVMSPHPSPPSPPSVPRAPTSSTAREAARGRPTCGHSRSTGATAPTC